MWLKYGLLLFKMNQQLSSGAPPTNDGESRMTNLVYTTQWEMHPSLPLYPAVYLLCSHSSGRPARLSQATPIHTHAALLQSKESTGRPQSTVPIQSYIIVPAHLRSCFAVCTTAATPTPVKHHCTVTTAVTLTPQELAPLRYITGLRGNCRTYFTVHVSCFLLQTCFCARNTTLPICTSQAGSSCKQQAPLPACYQSSSSSASSS